MKQIYHLLLKLGIGARYRGFHYLAYAIFLTLEDQSLLLAVTKQLYPRIAKKYQCTWTSVERALRMAVSHFWDFGNRPLLERIAGYPIWERPSVSELIDILAGYLSRAA